MNGKYLSTIMFKHPPVKKVFIGINSDNLYIFGYVLNQLCISRINIKDNYVSDGKHDFDGEILLHQDVIIRIFADNGLYYGIDKSGSLFTILQQSNLDVNVEYDLFEDSPQKSEKWTIENLKINLQDFVVLNACTTKCGEVALLTSCERSVCLKLMKLPSGEILKSIPIKEPGFVHVDLKTECLMEWVSAERSVPAFFDSWFKEARDGDFIIITLPHGCLLTVFPESGFVECLYIWYSDFLSCHWDYDLDSVTCGLRLVSQCGAVLQFEESGELNTSFLPTAIKSAHFSSVHLYCSDWKDAYLYPPPTLIPLQGIISWAEWGSLIFAFSRSGEVYGLDNSKEIEETNEELLPDSSLTTELLRKNAALEEINAAIIDIDQYISAIILSKKRNCFSLSAQMLSVGRREQSLCLVIRCLTEGMEISQKIWSLSLTVQGQTSIHRLRKDIGSEPLVQIFRLNLPESTHLSVKVSLFFSCLPRCYTYLPIIPVGKVSMGPSFFLLPAIELKTEYVPPEPDLESLFQGANSTFLKQREEEREDIQFSIKFSSNYSEDAIFRDILNDSKALWRTSVWDCVCKDKKVELAVLNKLVRLEITEGEVRISGEDLFSCLLTKEAILSLVNKNCQLRLQAPLVGTFLQSLIASSEVLESMDEPHKEKMLELRKLLRENVTYFLHFD